MLFNTLLSMNKNIEINCNFIQKYTAMKKTGILNCISSENHFKTYEKDDIL